MKLLSFCVPCYNSQDYMEKCVSSLLYGGEDVEIIIVDDGSSDNTAIIGDRLEKENPGIVRCIHQENGGHGEAVNTGIKEARGLFYKVVDSDDWVDEKAYEKVLNKLRDITQASEHLDLMICNFVYEKQGATHKKVMAYKKVLPQDKIFTWDEVGHFHTGQYILMHSVIYRTKLLRDCKMKLPAHTFYVDNIFVFEPLPSVKYMYYLDVNFYRYFIGRDDQSVNESVMIGRVDQQLKVSRLMIDFMTSHPISNSKTRRYMKNYLDIIMTISSIMLIREGSAESLKKKKELWTYLRDKDYLLYMKIRHGFLGTTMNLKGKAGRKISVMGYKLAQRIVGFN